MTDIERLQGGLYNAVTGGSENLRVPTSFVSASFTTATSTTLWTPAAGKKFRVLGYAISATADVACGTNGLTIGLKDGGTTVFRHALFAPTSSVTTASGSILIANVVLPGNGYLSTAINAVLSVSNSVALTAGLVIAQAYGCEE